MIYGGVANGDLTASYEDECIYSKLENVLRELYMQIFIKISMTLNCLNVDEY